tara:strand:- start:77 stop:376 length:300 start_codon:yes stop_codon:yes gene_type:complete
MANYESTSPYYATTEFTETLGLLNKRQFEFQPDDVVYEIDSFYEHRPDLLSFDLYGTPKLWWVFQHRNMDVITDPIWSFEAGTLIRIPKKSILQEFLNV